MFNDNNKENVIFNSSTVLTNTNGRRSRSRTNNTPSPVVITRDVSLDSAGRPTQSPPTRTLRLAIEDADPEITEAMGISDSNAPQRNIRLPKHLTRPNFKAISPEALEAVDPDLKYVPLEYILTNLQRVGQQMFAVAATTTAHPPRNRLPRELEVVVTDFSTEAPTHLFAVFSRPATRVTIHPAHALILAAHCAHLTSLPRSNSPADTAAGACLVLPVVPLCVPNPATFPVLLRYLYTKHMDNVFASLLPMPPQEVAAQSVEQLAQSLAATFTVQGLLSHAARVHGLWGNATALGVFDEKLWRGVEMMWEVLLDALAISTGSSWQTEQIQSQR